MDEKVNILLVEAPGRWRDSLLVLLHASPIVGEVQVWDGEETLPFPPIILPDILLLDASAPAAWSTWQQLQNYCGRLFCCALVHSLRQEQAAHNQGVDAILRAGYTAEALFSTLARLVHYPGTGQK